MQCRKKEELRTMARPQSVVGIVSNLKLLTTGDFYKLNP